mgnify:FL=1
MTLDALFEKVKAVAPQTGVETLAVAGIADFLSPLKAFLGKLFKKIPTGKVNPIPGLTVGRFMNLLQKMPSDFVEEQVDPDARCLMQYTGGTTGPPKGAVLTHRNMVSQIQQTNTWLDVSTGQESTLLSAFPLFHQAGLFLGMDAMAFGGTQVAVPNPRDLDFLIAAIKKHKPRGIVNVPNLDLEL